MARSVPSIFLPLRFTNTKLLGARFPPTPNSLPRFALASLSPGHVPDWPPSAPLFGQFPALPSASSSTAGVCDDARFLSALIDRTRDRIQLDSNQISSLSR